MGIQIVLFLALFLYGLNEVHSEIATNEAGEPDLEVIIDTDPGGDDAMAILLMLSEYSRAKVLAVTTVTGNTGVVNGTKNALLILKAADRLDIPVYSGTDQGLVFPKATDFYFGYDGLGDSFPEKPKLDQRKDGHAALAIANLIKENAGRITLLCLGPLTNLALAMHIYPKLLEDVKDVVILGGSHQGEGSFLPGLEFNAYADPEAAAFVYSRVPSGKPLRVIPSETTTEVQLPMDWRLNVLGKLDSCFMKFMNGAERSSLTKQKKWGYPDQVAASVLLNPSVVKSTKDAYIVVETCGKIAQGTYIVDSFRNNTNVRLITKVNKKKIKELLLEYLDNSNDKCNFDIDEHSVIS